MNTFKSLIAAAATLALLSGMATPVLAQEKLVSFITGQTDPFEVSKQNCIDKGWVGTSCVVTNDRTGVFPIGQWIDEAGSTMKRYRERNGWGPEVTPDTLVPIGSMFAFG